MGVRTDLLPIQYVGVSVGRSVVWWVNCGKTANWVWMPFGVVNGIGRGMGVLDGGGDHGRGRAVLRVNVGHPIVTNGYTL